MDEPTNLAYHYSQKVQRLERDAPDAKGINEEYTRAGLLLLASQRTLKDWNRVAIDYESDAKFLTAACSENLYPREKLLAEHQRLQKTRKLPITFPGEFLITADTLNTDPSVDLNPAPPYALAIPTLIPSVLVGKPEKDKTWTGSVRIQYGFAEFKLPWTATLTDVGITGLEMEVALAPKDLTVWGINVVLQLKPEGKWKLTQGLLDAFPTKSEGKYTLSVSSVSAKGDKPQIDEIGRCAIEFNYKRVPVKFDEKNIYPGGWKDLPKG
jgi:hypothetical protein